MQSHIPIGRVTTYAFIVIVFFLLSQAPYWITQIYTTFLLFINQSFGNVIYITYICHMCPFLAAALNWIFYARMNTQLRKGFSLANEHYSRDIRR
ncbi:unnamed protein product [Enterobius vermicularis]|uniref:G_PROTEIN_RECEP_F1_2 domain-containing protein n=1 Tax=Enterobius vermicularis TaxID=51028 RepID=A0A0N4VIU3_ENTVE|nr:unnamed protein product [Enterobius vermicularis]